jgi:hypothetical protein
MYGQLRHWLAQQKPRRTRKERVATYKPFESISQSVESVIAPLIQVVDAPQDVERGLYIISYSGDWKD